METIDKGCQMSYKINTNIQALWANATSKEINRQIDVSMERLSTGLRINRAADDK